MMMEKGKMKSFFGMIGKNLKSFLNSIIPEKWGIEICFLISILLLYPLYLPEWQENQFWNEKAAMI